MAYDEMPTIPAPYRTRAYAFPDVPLVCARRVETPDGASLACFVYAQAQDGASPTSDEELHTLLTRRVPVLMLHGNGGSHSSFCAVIERVCAAGLCVVAFDARAQGQSTRGTEPLTYELLAQDALCVLDALGIEQAHVLGHSDGGIEALLLARDHPERIASIVAGGANLTPEGVVDGPGWDTPGSAKRYAAWTAWAQQAEEAEETAAPLVDLTLLPSALDSCLNSELFQLMLDEPHIEASSLATIHCPSCVLVGEHDCITWDETRAIHEAIPGARLVVVPKAGHSLPRVAPDAVALQVMTNVLLCASLVS